MVALGQELEGITVVSMEQAVAAPYCGLLLADSGARVIKVEREGGDFARSYDHLAGGESAYFVWLNAGKESVVLDIDAPGDRAVLDAMLAKADVFLQNLAPGALERRGLSGPALREVNPGLITCEITGYGRFGPYERAKAYDMLLQAETGLLAVTGTAEASARVGVSVCDIATGLTAYSAILRALLLRARTGEGCDLSISMFDVLSDWMNVPLLVQRATGAPPRRLGVDHANLCPYGAYEVGDGGVILLAVQSQREWRIFCDEVLGRPDLADDPRFAGNADRCANREALHPIIRRTFEGWDRDALLARLTEVGIANASLNQLDRVLTHPQLTERQAALAGGAEVPLAALPVKGALAGRSDVPALDAQGDAIRREFGPRQRS
ncbi:CoA transferase [Aquicoccus sp. SCR17]|nr:CoA transferase [Carideicomes alvinocaridis]